MHRLQEQLAAAKPVAPQADPPDFTKLTPEAIRSTRGPNAGRPWKND